MESLIFENLHNAHWILFGLLMLAGLNVPISEDLLLITGGAIASSFMPEKSFHLYGWLLAGCWFSAWEAYSIGRYFGPKLYDIKWFNRILSKKHIDKLHHYFEKFGVLTFIIGRFIPGGFRNALFMTAGLGRMPFLHFILRDSIGCIISATFLFTLGYACGQNYHTVIDYFSRYSLIVIAILISALLLYLLRRKSWRIKTGSG